MAGTTQFTNHDRNRISVASRKPTRVPVSSQHVAPAEAAKRERQVVGDECERQKADVGPKDERPCPAEVDAKGLEGERQKHDREDDRCDRLPVENAPRKADLALGDRLVGGRVEVLGRLVDGALVIVLVRRSDGVARVRHRSFVRLLLRRQLSAGRTLGRLTTNLLGRRGPEDRPGGGSLAAPRVEDVLPHRPARGERG